MYTRNLMGSSNKARMLCYLLEKIWTRLNVKWWCLCSTIGGDHIHQHNVHVGAGGGPHYPPGLRVTCTYNHQALIHGNPAKFCNRPSFVGIGSLIKFALGGTCTTSLKSNIYIYMYAYNN
jgi:hypothetical protein